MSEIDFYKRLNRLEKRRKGTDLTYNAFDSVTAGVTSFNEFDELKRTIEKWQIVSDKPSIRYAVGAMQEVSKRYTEISIETAKRIEKQLEPRLLNNHNIVTEYRLQGSVPLNIHIKGVSDVDLLVLNKSYYRTEGYLGTLRHDDIKILRELRNACTYELRQAYPAVTIDTTGAKSITLTGGSLPRDVDVVPSHWVETYEYQQQKHLYLRGVNILDNKTPTTLMNLPFKHIFYIDYKCKYYADGGLKKSIRLCKTIKADLVEEGKVIYLSSFDLASIMYHSNLENLKKGRTNALAIVLETKRFFDYLYHNPNYRNSLYTPDMTRKIFDSYQKETSLTTMSIALDKLVTEIRKDLGYLYDETIGSYPLVI